MIEFTDEELMILYGAVTAEILRQEDNLKDWNLGGMQGHVPDQQINNAVEAYNCRIAKLGNLSKKLLKQL